MSVCQSPLVTRRRYYIRLTCACRFCSRSTVSSHVHYYVSCFFFFQAEDGIRDHCVTGVQCALPILAGALGVTLEKPGAYRLGAGPLPDPEAIDRACRILALAVVVSGAAMVAGAVLLVHFFFVGARTGWVS